MARQRANAPSPAREAGPMQDEAYSELEVVRELPVSPTGAGAVLVCAGGRHYIVSSVFVPYFGPETLVFSANEDGEITDWLEVAGGRGMSREEAIDDLRAL